MNVRVMLGSLVLLAAVTALAPAASPWTAPLTREAMTSGFKASVPPHVALVLGLSPKDEAVETRQLVSRAEQKVRTFNVSLDTPQRIVLFVVDEQARRTVAYLLSASGKLRKAVSYETGGAPHVLPDEQARPGLAREVRFWTEHASATAPAPAPGTPPAANTPH